MGTRLQVKATKHTAATKHTLSAFAHTVRCCGLVCGIGYRFCFLCDARAICGTELAYGAMVRRKWDPAPYQHVRGTELAYGATQSVRMALWSVGRRVESASTSAHQQLWVRERGGGQEAERRRRRRRQGG
eukprot:2090253-Rhodomonas_salina.1